MALIYITGPTGAGKSTVCDRLRERGLVSYDVDEEGMRQKTILNKNSKPLLTIAEDTLATLKHKAAAIDVYLCGTLPNDQDFIHNFDKVLVLVIDEKTQRSRILQRTNNSYGHQPNQLSNAQKWRDVQIKKYISAGATVVDACQPVNDVVRAVLAPQNEAG